MAKARGRKFKPQKSGRFKCANCPPTKRQFFYLSQLAADADYKSPGAAIKDCLGIAARSKINRKQASDVIRCLKRK